MKRILVVFGTRPEAIKMCPVINELKGRRNIECKVVLTGQHREMLAQVMRAFSLKADYNLDIMRNNQSLTDITCLVMKGLSEILKKEKPDLVLVHGDTTTSYAAAIECFYQMIPVGHVEAGLRTHNLFEPFPEEFNRQSIDNLSSMLFAPTQLAKENLLNEGKSETCIFVTGNTVIDALKTTVFEEYTDDNVQWALEKRFILMTVHRRESFGEPMAHIFKAIKKLANDRTDVRIIYPVHKNPVVRKSANDILGDCKNIRLIEPLDVIDFHNYMAKCFFVLTDSGGIQEEAPSLGKPVLVLRNVTERPEGIKAGTLKLTGCEERNIYKSCLELLDNVELYSKMSKASNPYGDGLASKRICDVVCKNV